MQCSATKLLHVLTFGISSDSSRRRAHGWTWHQQVLGNKCGINEPMRDAHLHKANADPEPVEAMK